MTVKGQQAKAGGGPPSAKPDDANRRFAIGLVRASGGAVLFSFPMLMTMEMWALGFYVDPLRLAVFIALGVPLLIALAYYGGFEKTSNRMADALDALTAFTVGFAVSALLLSVFGIVGPGMSVDEVIGKIAIQAVPASIGALLSRSQFGESKSKAELKRGARYGGGLFLMTVGALYLSLSLASTEEMVLISYKMSPLQVLILLLLSLTVMHGFVYAVVAQGKSPVPKDVIPFWTVFLRFTVVGYAIALLISAYMLWTFGRMGGLDIGQAVQSTVVLGFPAALGAGTARLII